MIARVSREFRSGFFHKVVIQKPTFTVSLERQSQNTVTLAKYWDIGAGAEIIFGTLDQQSGVWIFQAINWDLSVGLFSRDPAEATKVAFFLYMRWRKANPGL